MRNVVALVNSPSVGAHKRTEIRAWESRQLSERGGPNDSKVEARAWRAAGWHVDTNGVDFDAETVRFARASAGVAAPAVSGLSSQS